MPTKKKNKKSSGPPQAAATNKNHQSLNRMIVHKYYIISFEGTQHQRRMNMANSYCKSEATNNFMDNVTATVTEYILEIGMEETVKKLVDSNASLDIFPHITAYAKEHGFI
jgi:hypothetical protein